MQVFKAFFKIIIKNKASFLTYICIFFALMLMISAAGEQNDKTNFSQISLNIAVTNEDEGKLGKALVDYLSEKNEIKKIPEEREELLDAMYYEEVEYVLEIPEDFSEQFMAGKRDELLEGMQVPGSAVSSLAESEIIQFLTTLAMYTDSGYEEKQAIEAAMETMQKESKVVFLEAEDTMKKEPASYYFQFLPYIFICTMVMTLGMVLIVFYKPDLDARNKCAALSFTNRNMQMILGSFVLMLVEYLLFIGVACVLYTDYMFSVKGLLSSVNAFIFILLCMALAFLVGRLVKKQEVLDMVSNVLGLGLSFLGGVFVPVDFFSEGVKKVSQFIPSYWYTISNEAIQKINNIQDANSIFINVLVVLGFAMAIFAVALLVGRMRARSV